jgi:hypothetical protein
MATLKISSKSSDKANQHIKPLLLNAHTYEQKFPAKRSVPHVKSQSTLQRFIKSDLSTKLKHYQLRTEETSTLLNFLTVEKMQFRSQ